MKRFARAAALLPLVFLISATGFAAEDSYTFTPPTGYTLAEDQTALWSNAAQTANINIIVEENDGVNPYDLTEEDLQELAEATKTAYTAGLADYNGQVGDITVAKVTAAGMDAVRMELQSSYTVEGVELKSRQVQYVFFTKEHCIYVTGTVLTEFADAEAELAAFKTAVETMLLHDPLYTEPTGQGNLLVILVVIGAIVGGAGGLALFLLRQRKSKVQAEEQ